ncbi:MAG TPA: DNA repair protein RadC [Balneolales bacterium]|nr:DNA repair protein RadC [Balneolales bacterium]
MNDEESFEEQDYLKKRRVKDLSADEQPREKLLRYGAESLSNSELLAILLRTGSGKMNVLDTSRALIDHFGGISNLSRKSWQELKVIPGIAKVKALTLEAVFELSRRLQVAKMGERITLKCPEDVNNFFGPKLRDLRKEHFIVAFLNAAKILTGYKRISIGGVTATIVDPAEVMKQAIMNDAHSIIVLHNHPSGNTKPSRADIQLTKRLVNSGKLLGISVEDHVIVAGYEFTSLRANGHMHPD